MNNQKVRYNRSTPKIQYKHSVIWSTKQYTSIKYKTHTSIKQKLSKYKQFDVCAKFQNDLTYDWFYENIHTQPCVYCGEENNNGADRIDNNKGHTKDNIVPACALCNITRANRFSHEEMLLLGNTIALIKKNRKD